MFTRHHALHVQSNLAEGLTRCAMGLLVSTLMAESRVC